MNSNIYFSFSVHVSKVHLSGPGKKNPSMLFQVPFKKFFQFAVKISFQFQRTFEISWVEIKVNEVATLCKAERKNYLKAAEGVAAFFLLFCFYLSILF